jgi:hypothetical protein
MSIATNSYSRAFANSKELLHLGNIEWSNCLNRRRSEMSMPWPEALLQGQPFEVAAGRGDIEDDPDTA